MKIIFDNHLNYLSDFYHDGNLLNPTCNLAHAGNDNKEVHTINLFFKTKNVSYEEIYSFWKFSN
ncbi:MAG: hypothetical protein IPH57_14675 [Saprospiraceae bacterium]|nr:hypothetical protein [Saprospiraceae bacterium]